MRRTSTLFTASHRRERAPGQRFGSNSTSSPRTRLRLRTIPDHRRGGRPDSLPFRVALNALGREPGAKEGEHFLPSLCSPSSGTFIRNLRILDGVEFIEAPTFTAMVADYLKDDEYRALQLFLAGDPEAGDVMPGTGSFRKLRWADRRRGKGKRGGLRVIYYYLSADAQIWLMTLYDKDEMADLSAAEKRALKAALEAELSRRAARRRLRRK